MIQRLTQSAYILTTDYSALFRPFGLTAISNAAKQLAAAVSKGSTPEAEAEIPLIGHHGQKSGHKRRYSLLKFLPESGGIGPLPALLRG